MKIIEVAPPRSTPELTDGDMYTIEGCGRSARGHIVLHGRSVKTGRRMKVKTLQVWKVRTDNQSTGNG